MSAIYLDQTNWDIEFDYSTGFGYLRFTTTFAEAAVQGIRQRLQTWRNEWFLNTNVGVPYIDQVFVKNPDVRFLEKMFSTIILTVPEIKSVSSVKVSINKNTRHATVDWSAVLLDNTTITSEDYQSFVLGDF